MKRIGSAASPLHQRATASIHVTALDYRSAGKFVSRLTPARRALVYGILGGTALYLRQWDARSNVRTNLISLFADPVSPLVDAAELVLSGELPELEGAFRILQAIALGRTRPSAISDYAKVAVERPLKRLTTLGILERRVPALEDPARSKRGIYRIADPYFAFWFRFIGSKRPDIARGLGPHLIDTHILPRLDDYMGDVFEEMAREHARTLAAADALKATRVEPWWSADGAHEIDIVGITGKSSISFVGSVKWRARKLDRNVLVNLKQHAASLPGYSETVPQLFYGRSGCRADLDREQHTRCFSIRDMYA
jgi:AAA+ ATPase superfamily predicted ATPase